MKLESLKAKLQMINDHYQTLPENIFADVRVFPLTLFHTRAAYTLSQEDDGEGGDDSQNWQGMVNELKKNTERQIRQANSEVKRFMIKQAMETRKEMKEFQKEMRDMMVSIKS
jgi:hypothetical protein